MKILSFVFCIAFVVASCNNEQSTSISEVKPAEKYDLSKDTSVYSGEMKRYWLVLFEKGPNRNQDSASVQKRYRQHTWQISIRLAKEGKIIMAGPIGVEGDIRGIFLMNCN